MEPGAQAGISVPSLPEFHSHPGKPKTPGERTEKRVNVKPDLRHSRDACGQRDECPDDWQQAGNENRGAAVTGKETFCVLELATAQQNVRPIAFHQRPTSVVADQISDQGAEVAA